MSDGMLHGFEGGLRGLTAICASGPHFVRWRPCDAPDGPRRCAVHAIARLRRRLSAFPAYWHTDITQRGDICLFHLTSALVSSTSVPDPNVECATVIAASSDHRSCACRGKRQVRCFRRRSTKWPGLAVCALVQLMGVSSSMMRLWQVLDHRRPCTAPFGRPLC